MSASISLLAILQVYLAGRCEMGAVQAGISKFPLLLGDRTGCTVNTGNEGLCACTSPVLTFQQTVGQPAGLESTPWANFGGGVALKVWRAQNLPDWSQAELRRKKSCWAVNLWNI